MHKRNKKIASFQAKTGSPVSRKVVNPYLKAGRLLAVTVFALSSLAWLPHSAWEAATGLNNNQFSSQIEQPSWPLPLPPQIEQPSWPLPLPPQIEQPSWPEFPNPSVILTRCVKITIADKQNNNLFTQKFPVANFLIDFQQQIELPLLQNVSDEEITITAETFRLSCNHINDSLQAQASGKTIHVTKSELSHLQNISIPLKLFNTQERFLLQASAIEADTDQGVVGQPIPIKVNAASASIDEDRYIVRRRWNPPRSGWGTTHQCQGTFESADPNIPLAQSSEVVFTPTQSPASSPYVAARCSIQVAFELFRKSADSNEDDATWVFTHIETQEIEFAVSIPDLEDLIRRSSEEERQRLLLALEASNNGLDIDIEALRQQLEEERIRRALDALSNRPDFDIGDILSKVTEFAPEPPPYTLNISLTLDMEHIGSDRIGASYARTGRCVVNPRDKKISIERFPPNEAQDLLLSAQFFGEDADMRSGSCVSPQTPADEVAPHLVAGTTIPLAVRFSKNNLPFNDVNPDSIIFWLDCTRFDATDASNPAPSKRFEILDDIQYNPEGDYPNIFETRDIYIDSATYIVGYKIPENSYGACTVGLAQNPDFWYEKAVLNGDFDPESWDFLQQKLPVASFSYAPSNN